MDRDQRWDRARAAYELISQGKADYTATSALQAVEAAYERGESDEFIKPTAIVAPGVARFGCATAISSSS